MPFTRQCTSHYMVGNDRVMTAPGRAWGLGDVRTGGAPGPLGAADRRVRGGRPPVRPGSDPRGLGRLVSDGAGGGPSSSARCPDRADHVPVLDLCRPFEGAGSRRDSHHREAACRDLIRTRADRGGPLLARWFARILKSSAGRSDLIEVPRPRMPSTSSPLPPRSRSPLGPASTAGSRDGRLDGGALRPSHGESTHSTAQHSTVPAHLAAAPSLRTLEHLGEPPRRRQHRRRLLLPSPGWWRCRGGVGRPVRPAWP